MVVVHLISYKQLCRNSLHSTDKVVFKAACLLQKCLNLLYSCIECCTAGESLSLHYYTIGLDLT